MEIAIFIAFFIAAGAFVIACITAQELEDYKQINIHIRDELYSLKTEMIFKNPPNKGSNVVDPKPKNTLVKVESIRSANKMRVKDCETCKHCKRRVWSQSYKPKNYHEIGISHAYAYCEKNKTRCLNVKHCDEVKQ